MASCKRLLVHCHRRERTSGRAALPRNPYRGLAGKVDSDLRRGETVGIGFASAHVSAEFIGIDQRGGASKPIDKLTKDQLVEVARMLALHISDHQARFGDMPRADLLNYLAQPGSAKLLRH